MPLSRTLAEVIHAHGDSMRDDIKVMLPAVVTAVHADRQTVDVQISVQNPTFSEFDGVKFEKMPSIADVPIGVMRGGGFFVWMPVDVGDSVMLIFSDVSMDVWRAGDGNDPVQPGWVGKHTVDSPVAIPCIAPDAKFFLDTNIAPGKIIIGKDGSQAQIRISDTEIDLGAVPTSPVALSVATNAAITALQLELTAVATWVALATAAFAKMAAVPALPAAAAENGAAAGGGAAVATAITTTGGPAVTAAKLLVPALFVKAE